MRLPVIKGFVIIIENSGEEKIENAIQVLEATSEIRGFKEEELEVIGELLSNMFGALEVSKDIASGTPSTEAHNNFMKRVMGSIDK
tara:strand:- start:2736 stop:2993 length:258 start_codon:yes stop_codon:yes gene_type:complete